MGTAAKITGLSVMIDTFRNIVRRLSEIECDGTDAWRDPLSHPAIRSMSARELADLPFSAGYCKNPK